MQHVQKENRRKPSVFAGFVAGAEGLEPSARGFGVDVGKRQQEREEGGVARLLSQAPEMVVLVWCCEKISGAETAPQPGRIFPKNFNSNTCSRQRSRSTSGYLSH